MRRPSSLRAGAAPNSAWRSSSRLNPAIDSSRSRRGLHAMRDIDGRVAGHRGFGSAPTARSPTSSDTPRGSVQLERSWNWCLGSLPPASASRGPRCPAAKLRRWRSRFRPAMHAPAFADLIAGPGLQHRGMRRAHRCRSRTVPAVSARCCAAFRRRLIERIDRQRQPRRGLRAVARSRRPSATSETKRGPPASMPL